MVSKNLSGIKDLTGLALPILGLPKIEHDKDFIGALKSNRLVALSMEDKLEGRFIRVEQIQWSEQEAVTGWLKGMDFPVRLARQVFTNKDNSTVSNL